MMLGEWLKPGRGIVHGATRIGLKGECKFIAALTPNL